MGLCVGGEGAGSWGFGLGPRPAMGLCSGGSAPGSAEVSGLLTAGKPCRGSKRSAGAEQAKGK